MLVDDMLLQAAMESGEIIADQPFAEYEEPELLELSEEACQNAEAQFMRGLNLMVSVQRLSSHFIASDVVTQASLESYRVSVAAAIESSGLRIPSAVVVPSFESAEAGEKEGATKGEGAKKKIGVFKRILDWLKNFLKTMGQAIMRFFGVAKKEFARNSATIEELEKKAARLSDKEKPGRTVAGGYGLDILGGESWSAFTANLGTAGNSVNPFYTDLVTVFTKVKGMNLDSKETVRTATIFKTAASHINGKPFLSDKVVVTDSGIDLESSAAANKRWGQGQDAMSPTELKKSLALLKTVNQNLTDGNAKITTIIEDYLKSVEKDLKTYETAMAAAMKWMNNQEDGNPDKAAKGDWAEWDKHNAEADKVVGTKRKADAGRSLLYFARHAADSADHFVKMSVRALNANLTCYKITVDPDEKPGPKDDE